MTSNVPTNTGKNVESNFVCTRSQRQPHILLFWLALMALWLLTLRKFMHFIGPNVILNALTDVLSIREFQVWWKAEQRRSRFSWRCTHRLRCPLTRIPRTSSPPTTTKASHGTVNRWSALARARLKQFTAVFIITFMQYNFCLNIKKTCSIKLVYLTLFAIASLHKQMTAFSH